MLNILDAIRVGCYNDCDSLVCHNGGHCTVHWQVRNVLYWTFEFWTVLDFFYGICENY